MVTPWNVSNYELTHSFFTGDEHLATNEASSLVALKNLERELVDGSLSAQESLVSIKILQDMYNNFTRTHHDWHFDLVKFPPVRAAVIAFYVIIIVIGVLSNGAVVFLAVSSRKSTKSVTNVFVINLALSDFGMCLFNLPVQLHYQLTDEWVFGETLCKIVFSAFALPMYLSSVTILLIAIDRYWLIVWPLRDRLSLRHAFLLIALNVSVSVVMATPVMYYTKMYRIENTVLKLKKVICIERWPSEVERHIFTAFTFLLQFYVPLTLTAFLYFRIYVRLKRRQRPGSSARLDLDRRGTPSAGSDGLISDSPRSAFDGVHGKGLDGKSEDLAGSRSTRSDSRTKSISSVLTMSTTRGSSYDWTRSSPPAEGGRFLAPPTRAAIQRDSFSGLFSSTDSPTVAGDCQIFDGAQTDLGNPETESARHQGELSTLRRTLSPAARRRVCSSRANKTNRILVAIVVNFIVCWLPWSIFCLIAEFSHSHVRGSHFKLVDLCLKGFAMSSACINPFFYCWLNDTLRKDFATIAIKLNLYRRARGGDTGVARTGSAAAAAVRKDSPEERPVFVGVLPKFTIQPASDGVDVRDEEDCSVAVIGANCVGLVERDHVRSASMQDDVRRLSSL